MTILLHRITVDVKRGFEQTDPRWAFANEIYKNDTNIFAFWDAKTSTQPSRSDIRPLAKRKRQVVLDGERPGFNVTDELTKSFTDEQRRACRYVSPEEEKVAVLKLVRTKNRLVEAEVSKLEVIGERREKSTGKSAIIQKDVLDQGVEVMMETNAFMLQGVNESFQEKFQISETFGEPVFFAFGERQRIFQFDGLLFDTDSWAWKERFISEYNEFLRGTKAIENGAFVTLITNTAVIQGYLLSCSIGQSTNTHGYVALSFAMFIQDRFPVSEVERSPQDQREAEKEDPRVVLFEINNLVNKPNEIIKEIERVPPSVVKVELPSGFQPADFLQTNPVEFRPTHFKPSSPVDGERKEVQFIVTPPGQPSYSPPDLLFADPGNRPNQYTNQMMIGNIGVVGEFQRKDLQAPPGTTTPAGFSMHSVGAFQSPTNTVESESLFAQAGGSAQRHQELPIRRLKDIAKAGNLIAGVIHVQSNTIFTRKVSELRIGSDPGFLATGGVSGQKFNSGISNPGLNFEIQLDRPIKAQGVGAGDVFTKNVDQFRIRWFEDNTFLIQKAEEVYHSIDGGLSLRRVADGTGASKAVNATERYVLTDPGATFLVDLQTHIDAGDKISVVLPYAVIDLDSTTKADSEVPVTKVLSDTQLQLGLLQLDLANKNLSGNQLEQQRVGEVEMQQYKVLVRRASSIALIEEAIRKRVKNPPDGAFSSENLNADDQQLRQEKGVFEMKKGVHFSE